jgi:hypothetical protein
VSEFRSSKTITLFIYLFGTKERYTFKNNMKTPGHKYVQGKLTTTTRDALMATIQIPRKLV